MSLAGRSEPTTNAFTRWASQDYLLGGWDGTRPWLSAHGVDFEFFYLGSLPSNLGGGIQTGSAYQGAAVATLDLDSDKLLGYSGGTFHVSGLWLHGEKIFSAKYSGDYNRVNLVDFDNALRFWEIYYRQKFFTEKLSFKAGRLSIDSDFIAPEYFTCFGQFTLLNQTFANPSLPFNLYAPPGFPASSSGLAAMPLATPGAVVALNPWPQFGVLAGVYSGTPDQTESGTRWSINQHDGALNYLEAAWRHNPGTNNSGLGGVIKLGGYYHTSEFTDAYEGVFYAAGLNAAPQKHHGNYGGYLIIEHQLYLENGKADPAQQGLVGFFRALGAPSDRNLTQLELDGGLVYRGLIPTRDWDSLAVGYSHLSFSRDLQRAQQDINALAPGSFVPVDYENVIEVNYRAQLAAWWTLQGSFQHVFHPGGSAALPDANVLILQTTLRF
jgi:porin